MSHFFISYAHDAEEGRDKQFAVWLNEALRRNNYDVWFDQQLSRDALTHITTLNQEISAGIETCEAFFFIFSGMSLASRYCQAEVSFAMSLDKPIVRIDLDQVLDVDIPASVKPLAAYSGVSAKIYEHIQAAWAREIMEGAARQRVRIELDDVEIMMLATDAEIIRPPYSRLRTASAAEIYKDLERLSSAVKVAPKNGYVWLSRAFIQIQLEKADNALEDVSKSKALIPEIASVYVAEVMANLCDVPVQKMSKPEIDRQLSALSAAMQLPGAGAEIWLFSAMLADSFYNGRYLKAPFDINEILQQGVKLVHSQDAGECLRVWENFRGQLTPQINWAKVREYYQLN